MVKRRPLLPLLAKEDSGSVLGEASDRKQAGWEESGGKGDFFLKA